jgi:hypothetical protein
MNEPDPPHWTLNSCFGVLWTVSVLHEVRCKMGWTGAINAQVHGTKAHRNFLQWMHPILPIESQTHVLERFVTAWTSVQTGRTSAFNAQVYATKLHRNFCNERTQSSPLDPKLMFWVVSNRFVNTRTSVQNGSNWRHRCKSFCNEVASEYFATNEPDPPYWIPNSCFGAFWTVL